MTPESRNDGLGKHLRDGARHYRAFVGPAEAYDVMSATQFSLLTFLGLREYHYLLDIGCGSLRAGRLFITYLLKDRYFGVEPERWLVQEGIEQHLGEDLVRIKQPSFSHDENFTLTVFGQKFDFLVAQSIFSHTSQAQIRRCLSEARKVMQPGAVFAATFFEGQHDYTGDKWVYPGIVTYTRDRMRELIEAEGLVGTPIKWPRPNKQTWMVITHPGHENHIPDPDDAARLSFLTTELGHCRHRLSNIEHHPYVRFGLWVNQMIHRLKWKL